MPQYNKLPTSPPCAIGAWWALGNCFCITVDFDLTEAAPVTTQIATLQGKVVYSNAACVLAAGHYTLPQLGVDYNYCTRSMALPTPFFVVA